RRPGGRRSRNQRVDVLVRRRDHPDERANRLRFALTDETLSEDAVATRDELHDRLVSLDFGEAVARLHGVAFVLPPFHPASLLHRGRERLHEPFRRHEDLESQSRYMTLRTAAMVFGTSGFAARSRFFAYGTGTSA